MKRMLPYACGLVAAALTMTAFAGGDPCPGDSNNDGVVNVVDLLAVLNDYGNCPAKGCDGDVDGDGDADIDDLLLVINNFGPCSGTPACATNADCDDQDPCTIDLCVQGTCYHIDSPNPNCD